jgi:hypothetical protein
VPALLIQVRESIEGTLLSRRIIAKAIRMLM